MTADQNIEELICRFHISASKYRQNINPGLAELHAHDDRHGAPDQSGEYGEKQVHRADVFMVCGKQPATPAGWMAGVIRACFVRHFHALVHSQAPF